MHINKHSIPVIGDGAAVEQRSDGMDVGFQASVDASQIALLSPDPESQLYVTIVPTAFPLPEEVAPLGAAGGSSAHSPSQVPFMLESTPLPPPTSQE